MDNKDHLPNGSAVAAYLSAMVGLLVLGVSALLCEVSAGIKQWIHGLGKAWIPRANEIGPLSGKETLALMAWLVSWALLHWALRRKELNGGLWLLIFLAGIGLATTLVWPPVWAFFR